MATVNRSLLNAARTGFQSIFNEVFEDMKEGEFWSKVATRVDSTGRGEEYDWLGDIPAVREFVGERQIGDLKAYQYSLVNKKYEATIGVLREDIEDDKLGLYAPQVRRLATRIMQHKDKVIGDALKNGFSETCYDGQYFFDTDHEINGASVSNTGGGTGTNWFVLCTKEPVKPLIMQVRLDPEFTAMDNSDDEEAFMQDVYRYGVRDRKRAGYGLWQMAYGSKDTLNQANLKTAIQAIREFTDNKGEPLGLVPDTLVVPPSLMWTAKKLLEHEFLSDGAGAFTDNETKGALENLIVTAWVS